MHTYKNLNCKIYISVPKLYLLNYAIEGMTPWAVGKQLPIVNMFINFFNHWIYSRCWGYDYLGREIKCYYKLAKINFLKISL